MINEINYLNLEKKIGLKWMMIHAEHLTPIIKSNLKLQH